MKRERPIEINENNAKIFCLKLKRIFDKKNLGKITLTSPEIYVNVTYTPSIL